VIFFFLTFAKKKFFLQLFQLLPFGSLPSPSSPLAFPLSSLVLPLFVGFVLVMLATFPPFVYGRQRETPFNTSTNADNIKHFSHLAAAQIL